VSYNYSQYTTYLTDLMVTSTADTNFVNIQPAIIDYAEQRVYREMNLLATEITVASALSSGVRTLALPTTSQGTFVTTRYIKVYTPVGTTSTNGTAVVLTPVSRELIDELWPTAVSFNAIPTMFAMVDPTDAIFGPSPDQSYNVDVVGHIRPTPLSSGNPTTVLTTYLPDLFLAASMVFASGYMRNFGAQADNPQQAQSWENQYQLLKTSADGEQVRQKFAGWGWTADSISQAANVKRT
jgi:hypothetical protein